MTEYELTDALYTIYGTMNDGATMYFALVTTYLAASYVAGSKFTTAQVAVVNTLFILWTAGNVNTIYSTLVQSLRIQAGLTEIGATIAVGGSIYSMLAVLGFIIVQVGGILAALYFMWTVRHPKIE